MAPNKRKILEAARKYVQKGAKDKALKEYDRLLKLDPRDAKLRLEIGDTHRRWGQVDEAITAYTKVAEQYMHEGFDARAVAVFKQIQSLAPDRWASYVPLAELYQRMGLNSEAVQALQTAADGLHKAGQKREALELLRKMASLDPSNTTSRIKVADLLRQEGMNDEAIAEYEAACTELERQGEHEGAEKALERILEISPDRIPALSALGRNLLGRGLGQRAEPFVKRILEIAPDEAAHYELMADVYRAQGRDTELAQTYRTLADIHRQRGDEDRAREIIQRFVPPETLAPSLDVADGLDAAGDLLEEQLLDEEELLDDDELLGDDDLLEETAFSAPTSVAKAPSGEAESDVLELGLDVGVEVPSEAPASVPLAGTSVATEDALPEGDPDQLLAEASVYLRYGKRAQAIRNLKAVLAIDAEHRAALEKLGEAHADGGDSEEAVAAWVRAAELAHAEGDAPAVAVLRDRIGALSPEAVSALPGDGEVVPDDEIEELLAASRAPAAQAPEPAPEMDLELPAEHTPVEERLALADERDDDADEHDEIEIDADELEMLLDEDESGDPLLDDAALDTPLSADEALSDPTGEYAALEDGEPVSLQAAAAESNQTAAGASSSLSVSAQVNDDLEEAEFYRQQGLLDEAEGIYQRVLEVAPNHPLALVRMGEIAAERGGDAAEEAAGAEPMLEAPAPGVAEITEPAPEEPAELADEIAIEDLDLEEDDESEAQAEEQADAAEPLALEQEEDIAAAAADDADEAADEGEEAMAAASEEELFGATDAPGPIADDAVSDAAAAELTLGDDEAPAPEQDVAGASFDLAAELSDFFDDADGESSSSTSSAIGSAAEQDVFSAVFSEFKKGVSEQLGEGDHEAHYDLGIAYREMGLLEDAVLEFETASHSEERRLECLHLLGLCTLDLGRGEEAVAHLQQALDSVDPTGPEVTALRFDLGRAYESLGQVGEARRAWEAVAAVDPAFCQVSERLRTLGEAKAEAPTEEMESFEEFFDADDDGEASDPDDSTGEVVETEQHESFEDLIAEANTDADEAPAAQPQPEPEPEPDAVPKARRKKKISFV